MTDGVTAGAWVLSPGDEGYDAACRAAMMACGVNPDGFGTYSERLEKQGQIRDAYDEKNGDGAHRTEQALQDLGSDQYLTANSQSGHQVQNACFTSEREDPCGNYPPRDGSPGAASAFGYDWRGAPSTDHHGASCDHGTTHGEISKHLDRQWGGQATGTDLDMSQLRQSANENAQVHVSPTVCPQDPAKFNRMPAERRERADRINNAQQANAHALLGANPDAAAIVDAQEGLAPGTAASPAFGGASAEAQAFAAECQAADWEKKMEQMRADAINNSPIGQSQACADACAAAGIDPPQFTALSAEQQQAVVNANRPGHLTNDTPPQAPADRNINPPQQNNGAGQRGPGTPPNTPTMDDCRNFQGNYLAWQTANNGGQMPPWGGRVPARAQTGVTANPQASTPNVQSNGDA